MYILSLKISSGLPSKNVLNDSNALFLDKLKIAAEGEENLMPFLIEAFESYATIGEVCQVLREIWGEYEENVTL